MHIFLLRDMPAFFRIRQSSTTLGRLRSIRIRWPYGHQPYSFVLKPRPDPDYAHSSYFCCFPVGSTIRVSRHYPPSVAVMNYLKEVVF